MHSRVGISLGLDGHCPVGQAVENPNSIRNLQAARYVFAVATETGVGRALASIRLTGAASVGVRRAKALRRTAVESVKTFILC